MYGGTIHGASDYIKNDDDGGGGKIWVIRDQINLGITELKRHDRSVGQIFKSPSGGY